MLEQFRVESLAPESMPGLSSNLARRFLDWSNDFEASGMVETQLGMLLFTVAQVCRERICGTPMPAARADLVESTRFHLGRQVSVHLAPLRRARFSQPEFARAALPLAEHIGALCRGMEEAQGRPARTRARRNDFRLLFDQEDQDQAPPVAGFGRSRALDASDGQYRVFTRAFDSSKMCRDWSGLTCYAVTGTGSMQHWRSSASTSPALAGRCGPCCPTPWRTGGKQISKRAGSTAAGWRALSLPAVNAGCSAPSERNRARMRP
jgi:hypothetical protein